MQVVDRTKAVYTVQALCLSAVTTRTLAHFLCRVQKAYLLRCHISTDIKRVQQTLCLYNRV